ncbi:hypothetical protein [Streptomyces zaomyceticus]|uniref:hypothetical protein n=1 Tax=Streptomyces zaomyceticus TaxID=68286 RepID=UPI002E109628|nr:hypothetical protein OG237_43095 [Streptomyces zaomyceticus]
MTSLDWAGMVPAVAAAVQTAAVVVQVYWDRRRRGAAPAQCPAGCRLPAPCAGHPEIAMPGVHVQIGVLPSACGLVAVTVRAVQAGGVDGEMLPPAKEHGPW